MKQLITAMLLLLASMSSGYAQNAYYEARYIAAFDTSIFSDFQGGEYRFSYKKIRPNPSPGGADLVTVNLLPVMLTGDEKTAITNFMRFCRNPFSNTLQPLRLNLVNSATKKVNKAYIEVFARNSQQSGPQGANYVGITAALPLISGLLSQVPQLLGGEGSNISISQEQQTQIIDGLTKYYAEEFKKAQMQSYTTALKQSMYKFGELQIIFPQTFSKLKNTDPSRFPDLGNEYKDIFAADLKHTLPNLTNYIDKGIPQIEGKMHVLTEENVQRIRTNQYYPVLKLGYKLGDKLLDNYPLADLPGYLDNEFSDMLDTTLNNELITAYKSILGKYTEMKGLYDKVKDFNKEELKYMGQGIEAIAKQHLDQIRNVPGKNLEDSIQAHLPAFKADLVKYYNDLPIDPAVRAKLAGLIDVPVAAYIFRQMQKGDDALVRISALYQQKIMGRKIGTILHTLNRVQYNLRDTTKGRIWVSMQELQTMKPDEWKYFIGLMYQEDTAMFRLMGINSMSVARYDTIKANLQKQMGSLLKTLVLAEEVKKTATDSVLKKVYVEKMFSTTIELIENFNINPATGQGYIDAVRMQQFAAQAKIIAGIYNDIRNANYNNVAFYTLNFIKTYAYGNDNEPGDDSAGIALQKLDELGGFMSETLKSGSSEEVKNVIRKYAAQPATYVMKRERRMTVSVTGQPGYYAGWEKFIVNGPDSVKAVGETKAKFITGLTLPLGFELTFKLKRFGKDAPKKGNTGSLGVFAQVVDLGAVLNFRLSDSTSELPDDINIAQIFSPGLGLNYGFRNTPFNLGFCAQWAPALRSVDLTNGNTELLRTWRYSFRAVWDIPLINIGKSKKKYPVGYKW